MTAGRCSPYFCAQRSDRLRRICTGNRPRSRLLRPRLSRILKAALDMYVLSDTHKHDRHTRILADRRDALLGEIGVLKRLIQDVFAYRRAFISSAFLKTAPPYRALRRNRLFAKLADGFGD